MAINIPDYTVGFTEGEVLEILTIQKAELKKTMQQWQDSGSQVRKRKLDETGIKVHARSADAYQE